MGDDFRVGDWLVQPQGDCIECGEETVHLKPKAMAVLVCLARAGGGVVTRDELFENVWPGAVVSDATLTQCVVELRHAFGDSARDPAVIETVPRKGFRLIPPVVPVAPGCAGETGHGGSGIGDAGAAVPGTPARKWPLTLIAAVLLTALTVTGYWAYDRKLVTPAPADEVKSLAVLPFADLSEDQSLGWFANGLAEELRTGLTRLQGLQVAGGVSSSLFSSGGDDPQAVAEALGVHYLLMGSVRQESQRLRVTARVVDGATGFHLWSETFDRPQSDIFDVQAEISESLAIALSIELGVGVLGTVPG
ncbi:MAG TPA: winged helix-turn-helix domain-containing protein, partial [Xanthomonadales bacterium]|nr:winged helix-turn-helix domain-containing protein [Xanthomonadales bacterium]